MIPKIIHYCWFGGNPLPELAVKCIDSWKKYFPEYEIKEWNESNFDLSSCNYAREAYESKKWAFVSDYARFWILYHEGGIYFDTDVEVIQPLDEILENGSFFGEEGDGKNIMVNPGLGMASEPEKGIYKEIIEYYSKQSFFKKDGAINSETIVSRVTNILNVYGYKASGKIERIAGIFIYPPEYFCPKNYFTGELRITRNSYTIHHYSATWHEPEEEKSYQKEIKINKVFGVKVGRYLGKPVHMYYRVKFRIRENNGLIGAMKFFYRKLLKSMK